MTEFEKILKQLKIFIEEAGYEEASSLETMPEKEMSDLLRRFKREIKRRENAYSPNSAEYKSLSEQRKLAEQAEKLLRDKAKEESGLTLAEEEEETEHESRKTVEEEHISIYRMKRDKEEDSDRDKIKKDLDDKYELYMKARRENDVASMQKIYKQVAELQEKSPAYINLLAIFENMHKGNYRRTVHLFEYAVQMGNAAAALNLANFYQKGTMVLKNLEKAREYLDLAVKRENINAMHQKALELGCSDVNGFAYEKNKEAAFLLLKKYIEMKTPLDMTSRRDRQALYFCYLWGARSGYDMEREPAAEPWRRLLEVEGSYSKKALKIPAIILQGQGRYEEAVQVLLDAGTESAMEELEELFFHEYFTSRPQLQQNLENYLLQMRDSDETVPEVREELYEWYGWRYETGKDMIKDTAIAYAYYGRAAALGGWEKYQNYRNRILKKLEPDEKIVFFKNVLSQGYYDVAKEIAELYENNYQFENAKEFYHQGSEYAADRMVKQQCREGYARCKERLDKRQAQIEAATPSYHQCNTGLIGQKKDGFVRLREMAKQGNTYAALRFAQIAEQDSYLKDTMNNFPSPAEIFNCYKNAAEAGEWEAISRMAEIYEYGQLGQRRDQAMAERWRNKR
ncbi:MAG: SEL1-like repeat protein [Lachnospiraceae bacterium]|nr:SEL1-like repeat protein [Lachnospiraceae bacterium]